MSGATTENINLETYDPFADAETGGSHTHSTDDTKAKRAASLVHIRIQQRTGRKSITTVQGIDRRYNFKKIVKAFKASFCCNGNVVEHPEHGQVIQLQGDHRHAVVSFLVEKKLCKKDQIKLHGWDK
ncbi:eukaryotic translation initiation factor SUI1 [Kipferlia bialata]|uniref:Eukaryotic translation initiation factor SUI1 n=1 Tax=Kipferlia bialata TaxID=797122 RepID=A0A9K3GHR7_9EUKA|nr:eukaryotic translation initiation factor SUI1 [Kipferlia bialata]|eukprot:g3891.t1